MGFAGSVDSVRRGLALAIMLPALALAACDQSPAEKAQASLKSAQAYHQSGNLKAALVELKNALQYDPQSADARLLLGRVYVALLDGPDAEKELTRARELGRNDSETSLLLSQAHLLQQEYQEALNLLPADVPAEGVSGDEWLAARGQALLGLNRLPEAVEAFEQALSIAPNAVAHEGLARRALILGDFGRAARHIGAGLAIAPDDVNLLALDAERSVRRGNLNDAIAKFEAALEVAPGNSIIRFHLARTHARQRDYAAAQAELNRLLAVAPRNLDAKLLLAAIAFEQQDYGTALNHSRLILGAKDDVLAALFFAGASSLGLGQLESAQSYLQRLSIALPSSEVASRLLAATRAQLAQDAVSALSAESEVALSDARDLRLVTETAIQSASFEDRLRRLEALAKRTPSDAALHTQIGMMKIAMGDADEGAAALQLAQNLDPDIRSNPSYSQAEVALIETYLRTGQLEKALEEAQKLQASKPESPDGYLYAGVAFMSMNQPQRGEEAFKKALEVLPGHPPASLGLAEIEARRGNLDAAQRYLEASARAFPDDLRVIMRLAGVADMKGDEEQTKRWLDRAVATDPSAVAPRISLSRYYMAKHQAAAAVGILTPLLPDQERNPLVLRYLGQAYALGGDMEKAVARMKDWVDLLPNSPQAHLALADVYEMAGDGEALRAQLETVVQLDPQNAAVLARLGRLHLNSEDVSAAREVLAKLEAVAPERADGKEIAAGIALLEGDPARAADLYSQGRAIEDSGRLAVAMAGAQWEAGNHEQAVGTLKDWIDRNPEDVQVRFVADRYYRELGRLDEVEANLQAILTVQPQSWVAHNNLAEVKLKAGDTDAARQHAEKAYSLQPDHPGVKDTLGVVLHAQGENDRAVKLLQEAALQLPNVPVVSFHLARALADQGRTDEAKRVLDGVLAKEQPFPEREEAEKLRSDLARQ